MTKKEDRIISFFALLIIMTIIIGIISLCYFIPKYSVYRKGMHGKGMLREAGFSKQIQIESAKANLESEKLNALSEIERAKGVAEANEIIGSSLKGNEAYLRYLWINKLNDNNQNVIYIPTEAGMPILEAGNRTNNNNTGEM